MHSGNETWKWGVVFVLLAIFLITANQTYQHIASQETYAPPEDWKAGDSWDLEHKGGPGAGQAIELSPELQTSNEPQTAPQQDEPVDPPVVIRDDTDWSQIKDPTKN